MKQPYLIRYKHPLSPYPTHQRWSKQSRHLNLKDAIKELKLLRKEEESLPEGQWTMVYALFDTTGEKMVKIA